MENLKIKVNGKKDGDLAQELFFKLGYGFDGCKIKTIQSLEYTSDYYFFAYSHDMDLTHSCDYGVFMNKAHKEITLQELRDMVVFKRESLNDKIATAEVARQEEKHSHYKKDVSHLNVIDVYRVLELYGVESHAVGHAIKKLLCCGQRGAKGRKQDIQESIDSLNRELEMVTEDEL